VTKGDSIAVQVQIAGHGALNSITLPDQTSLRGFKMFFPSTKIEPANPLALDGTDTFEEIVIPQNVHIHEWPKFSFSYFNPDDSRYHTLTEPAVSLKINNK
jgi:hypothetical protein